MARTVILALGLVGRGACYQSRRDVAGEVSLLLNGEPYSGTVLLERLVEECMRAHCNSTKGCKMNVKNKTDADDYVVAVSAWPGARRMASTALKHTVPNLGHNNGIDFNMPPEDPLDNLSIERAVAKTFDEMPPGGRYVLILRDPRDVLMSACSAQAGGCSDADGFARKNMAAVMAWTSIRYKFFQALLAVAKGSVLTVFYEDIVVDPATAVRDISAFLNTPLAKGEPDRAAKAVRALMTDASSTRAAPHMCGFTHELSPLVIRALTVEMHAMVPRELSLKWPCGR